MLNSVNKIYFIKFIDINSLLCSYQSFIKRWLSLDALDPMYGKYRSLNIDI